MIYMPRFTLRKVHYLYRFNPHPHSCYMTYRTDFGEKQEVLVQAVSAWERMETGTGTHSGLVSTFVQHRL